MTDVIDNLKHGAKDQPNVSTDAKLNFDEPKLTFIEPTLTKQGDATQLTKQNHNGFFGTFPL